MAFDLKNIKLLVSEKYPWVNGVISSQIGGRDENQDSWGYQDTPFGFLLTVCDGMGGGPAGAIASNIAVDEILKSVRHANPEEARINIIRKAIRNANEAIIEAGKQNPMLQGMGSTCVVLLVNETSAIAAYVGDSRIYLLRGNHKKWRTFDHSMVFGLVKQGVITEEQARLSAQSNIITRALGIKLDIEVDAFEIPFEKGDRFALTSDGVHGSMPEVTLIKKITNKKIASEKLVEQLVKEVDQIGTTNGGHHDNNTIAILDIKKTSKLKPKMSKKMKQVFWGLCIILVASIVLNCLQWIYYSSNTVEETTKEEVEVVEPITTPPAPEPDPVVENTQEEPEEEISEVETEQEPE